MLEMIERMVSDRLWIYTGIAGSLFGAEKFLHTFKITRAGLWCYAKFDMILDYLVERWGWTWFKQQRTHGEKKYPYVTKKIDELERRLHYLEDKDKRQTTDGR